MKYLVFAAAMFCFCCDVYAQDTSAAPQEPVLVINNSSGSETHSPLFLPAAGTVAFPDCNSPRLQEQVQKSLLAYEAGQPQRSADERRQQALNSKNTSDFKPVSVLGFKPETNYDVANRIIELKLNRLIQESEMRLCSQNNRISGRTVYLLMSRADNRIQVEIIGYLPRNAKNPILYFEYQ